MARLLERYLLVITLAMSLPLFISFQINNSPAFLWGLSYAALWSWDVLSAIMLPILVALEPLMCAWLLWHRPAGQSPVWRHGAALLAAVAAEVVFWLARRNLA